MKKALYFGLVLVLLSVNLRAASNQEIHTGSIQSQQLLNQYPSFQDEYQQYQLEQAELNALNLLSDEITIKAFFGTWCHDSQREVPRLLKYLQSNHTIHLELYGLDIRKQDPQQQAQLFNVRYTPTFIILKRGKEIGRIVERPVKGLIQDIAAMLKQ